MEKFSSPKRRQKSDVMAHTCNRLSIQEPKTKGSLAYEAILGYILSLKFEACLDNIQMPFQKLRGVFDDFKENVEIY